MKIVNSKEVDLFCWEHRNHGVKAIKGDLRDEDGLQVNIAFEDVVTGEFVQVVYEI